MGPGAKLQIYDASQAGDARWNSTNSNLNLFREYVGYDGYIVEDLVIEAETVAIMFTANTSAEPAAGPTVEYKILPNDTGLSNSSIRKIIVAGGVILFTGYVILALFAWRRFQSNDAERRQAEHATARCVSALQNEQYSAIIDRMPPAHVTTETAEWGANPRESSLFRA